MPKCLVLSQKTRKNGGEVKGKGNGPLYMCLKHRSKVELKINKNFGYFFVEKFSDVLASFKVPFFANRVPPAREFKIMGAFSPKKWDITKMGIPSQENQPSQTYLIHGPDESNSGVQSRFF